MPRVLLLPVLFLLSLAPARAAADALVLDGAHVYAERCAICHGADLEGQRRKDLQGRDTVAVPALDGTGYAWTFPDPTLRAIVDHGARVKVGTRSLYRMPTFGKSLTGQEVEAVVAFLKASWPETLRRRQEELTRMVEERRRELLE